MLTDVVVVVVVVVVAVVAVVVVAVLVAATVAVFVGGAKTYLGLLLNDAHPIRLPELWCADTWHRSLFAEPPPLFPQPTLLTP